MTNAPLIQTALVLVLLLWAAGADWHVGRIPNVLTLSCWPLSLLLALGPEWGWPVDGASAGLGMAAAAAITLPLYGFRWLGAGDAKLAIALGGLLGFPAIAVLMLAWMVCSGLLALLLLGSARLGWAWQMRAVPGGAARQFVPHAVSLLLAYVLMRLGGWSGALGL